MSNDQEKGTVTNTNNVLHQQKLSAQEIAFQNSTTLSTA